MKIIKEVVRFCPVKNCGGHMAFKNIGGMLVSQEDEKGNLWLLGRCEKCRQEFKTQSKCER